VQISPDNQPTRLNSTYRAFSIRWREHPEREPQVSRSSEPAPPCVPVACWMLFTKILQKMTMPFEKSSYNHPNPAHRCSSVMAMVSIELFRNIDHCSPGRIPGVSYKEAPEDVEDILRRTMSASPYPESFTLLGRDWVLQRDVFPSTLTAATEVMASILPYPRHGAFLEVGSGTGVIAVMAALAGCSEVVALDINKAAVANTEANARKHGVADRIRVLHSDLFESLDPSDKFDAVFWNVPWTYVDEMFPISSQLQRAVFDPGYGGQATYIANASRHLTDQGRLFIGTADLGDLDLLDKVAASSGMRIERLQQVRRIEVHRIMVYELLELHPL
jgi:precorrin-6B methylase 2